MDRIWFSKEELETMTGKIEYVPEEKEYPHIIEELKPKEEIYGIR